MIEIIGKNGAGKTYIANQLYKRGFSRNIGYTTRSMRSGEIQGLDYIFVSKEEFKCLIESEKIIEYKIRNGSYYGLSRDGFKENSILVSGDTKKIEEETGFKIFKIYIDSDIQVRYNRVRRRNSTNQDVFYRFHNENYSFLDNFDAMFVSNEIDNEAVLTIILDNISINGSIDSTKMDSNVNFLKRKINEFNFETLNNYDDQMVKLLQYEEYLIRKLFLEYYIKSKNLKYEKLIEIYYEIMINFMKHHKINYKYTDSGYIIILNNDEYNLDFKLKRKVK